MHISLTSTFFGGSQTGFPTAVQKLEHLFPNSSELLDTITEADTLKSRGRWMLHILGQLTFSYLSKDYLSKAVLPALEAIDDDTGLPSLTALRELVQRLSSSEGTLDATTIPGLNDAALAVTTELQANHATIITNAMNSVGRRFFAKDTPSNRRAMTRALNLLFLSLCERLNEMTVCRLFRDAIAPLHTAPEKTIKPETISRLIQVQADLCRRVNMTVFFVLPDIKMHCDDFSIGDATFMTAASATQWVSENGNPQAVEILERHSKRTPYAAFVRLASTSHPADAGGGISAAAERLELVTGFIASQAKEYAPARCYTSFAFAAGHPGCSFRAASGAPSASLFLAKHESASTLSMLYRDYIQPALRDPVEPALREKLRQALMSVRRARFGVGCAEYSQAFSAAWQTLELLFGGSESRDRGATISKRVAALAVGPEGFQSNDSIVINDEDLILLAKDQSGPGGSIRGHLSAEILVSLQIVADEESPDVSGLNVLRAAMSSDDADAVMDWVVERRAESASANPANVLERQDDLRARMIELYKLRNDIAHSGQSFEPFAELAARELVGLIGSFIANIAFNFEKARTVQRFHELLDDCWRATHPPSPVSSEPDRTRIVAYLLWRHRGSPVNDAFTDWFAAERVLRL